MENANTRQLYFSFAELHTVFYNSTPEKNANIWWTGRDRISAINFAAAQLHFLSDVFVAIAAVVG